MSLLHNKQTMLSRQNGMIISLVEQASVLWTLEKVSVFKNGWARHEGY